MRRNGRVPGRRKAIVLLLFLVLITLGIASLANRWKGELQVERLDVRGCRILTEKEVITLANVPIGRPLYDVDLVTVRSRLRTSPYVRDAVVVHDLPSTIKIAIKERTPIAILGSPEPFYISDEGYVLPSVSSKEVFDLPVITGLSDTKPLKVGMKIESENFKAAVEILTEAATLDRDLYHLISEINLSGVGPTVYTAEHGIPILFDRERIHTQLVYLQGFWNQYVRQQGLEQVSSIDLRFEDQVVVCWNKPISQEKSL